MQQQEKLKNLKSWNYFMSFLHFAQGVAMIMLSNNFKLPVTTSFLKFDTLTQSLVPNVKTWFEIPIGWAVAAFLLISALFHFLIATVWNKKYNENLQKGANFYRWLEYSISSSIMIVIITMLVGIYDISALIPIFIVNASMILFGWMMELHNQTTQKTNWTSYIFGCIAGIAPWIVIAIYLASPGSESNPPSFVYWIFFTIFLFFNCFAINQVLQYKKIGRWADYLYGEKVYIILSLVAKSLLAWQVFAGTLRPM